MRRRLREIRLVDHRVVRAVLKLDARMCDLNRRFEGSLRLRRKADNQHHDQVKTDSHIGAMFGRSDDCAGHDVLRGHVSMSTGSIKKARITNESGL
jgi:hypothetical protein